MKHLARILSLLILVSAGLFIASCGGTDPSGTSDEETALNKFKAGQWSISSVTFSSATSPDITTEYAGFKVTFTGTFLAGGQYDYTSVAPTGSWPTPNAWKPSSAWKFKSGAVNNTIVRLYDNQDMAYEFSNGDKTLKIKISGYTGETFNGRVNSVDGDWTFIFNRP